MNAFAPKPRVLIADDQPDVLEALRLLLKAEGFEIETAASPGGDPRGRRPGRDFDVVLMDLNYTRDTTSGREGLDLLARLRGDRRHAAVVVMTAWGSVGRRRRGDAPRRARLRREAVGQRAPARHPAHPGRARPGAAPRQAPGGRERARCRCDAASPTLIAESPAMQPVLELIERVGPSDANVLITGENGTGKEVVARAAARRRPRAPREPLVTVNAGGLSEGVFESELFGHVKGAFTDAKTDRVGRFELADGGTLFLDEIANMPLDQQAKLLRVLQTGEFERVGSSQDPHASTCASSRRPTPTCASEVADGPLPRGSALPPQHGRDPPAAAARAPRGHPAARRVTSCAQHAAALPQAVTRLRATPRWPALLAHPWPGNVRELDHAVERAVLMARGDAGASRRTSGCARRAEAPPRRLEDMTLEEVEKVLIQKALARYDGNVSQAAAGAGPVAQRALPAARAAWPLTRPATAKPDSRPLRAAAAGRLAFEDRILLLALVAGLPGTGCSPCSASGSSRTALKLRWTVTLVVALPLGLARRRPARRVVRPLQTLSNLLAALREGDFSLRARQPDGATTPWRSAPEVNALGETLREQRLGALEATALLHRVIDEIDVAVFAFDAAGAPAPGQPRRRAAARPSRRERLLGQPAERRSGSPSCSTARCSRIAARSPSPAAPGAGRSGAAPSARAACPTACWCSPTSRRRCARRSGRPGSG